MKSYLPTVLMLVIGLVVMVTLLYLGAMSQNWVAPLCYLGVAVVYHMWFKELLYLAWPELADIDEDDDRPIFPG